MHTILQVVVKIKIIHQSIAGHIRIHPGWAGLRYSNFVKVDLPLIPLEEQKAIADYINVEVAKIDNVLPSFQKGIDLLREYRTRLISDVVTGQIDVRDVVIPEYIPEDDTEIDVADTPDNTEEVAEDAE